MKPITNQAMLITYADSLGGDLRTLDAVLEEHLPAPSAGHQEFAVGGHARQRQQPPAAAGMQGADHSTLRTETQAI